MSKTITPVDIANKDDAKRLVAFFIDQEEQVAKIEITRNGDVYAGSVTFNDPPAGGEA
jgi:hypothetical protein